MSQVTIPKTCISCNGSHEIKMDDVDYFLWTQGAHIQKVAPYLSEGERELLISRVCGTCFDDMFAEEDDE